LSTFVKIYAARAKTSPERQLSGEYTQANAQVKSQKPSHKSRTCCFEERACHRLL